MSSEGRNITIILKDGTNKGLKFKGKPSRVIRNVIKYSLYNLWISWGELFFFITKLDFFEQLPNTQEQREQVITKLIKDNKEVDVSGLDKEEISECNLKGMINEGRDKLSIADRFLKYIRSV